jgi:hypothetical protein
MQKPPCCWCDSQYIAVKYRLFLIACERLANGGAITGESRKRPAAIIATYDDHCLL